MDIVLYGTATCPKCKVLDMKLQRKRYDFKKILNEEILISKGIKSVPQLQVDGGELMDFVDANQFINNLPEVE